MHFAYIIASFTDGLNGKFFQRHVSIDDSLERLDERFGFAADFARFQKGDFVLYFVDSVNLACFAAHFATFVQARFRAAKAVINSAIRRVIKW